MEPEVSLPRLQVPFNCSYPEPDQSILWTHPTSWKSISILPSSLTLVFQVISFPQVSPTKTLYGPLLSPIHAIRPTHLILLCFLIRILFGEEYRSLSSSLCSFLHFCAIFSLLGPDIPLSTLFSNTPQLTFPPKCERPIFTLIQNNRQTYIFVYLIFIYLG